MTAIRNLQLYITINLIVTTHTTKNRLLMTDLGLTTHYYTRTHEPCIPTNQVDANFDTPSLCQ